MAKKRYWVEDEAATEDVGYIERLLANAAKDGWELVTAYTYHCPHGFERERFVFKKLQKER